MRLTIRTLKTALMTLLICSAALAAQQPDREQPVNIRSDTVEIDESKGVTIYRGRVRIRQGNTVLEADQATVHDKGGVISKVVAEGSPTRFRKKELNSDLVTHAYGKIVEYFGDEERIVIKQEARLKREQNLLTGQRIDYDFNSEKVNVYSNVDGKPGGGERYDQVETIIFPKTSHSNGA